MMKRNAITALLCIATTLSLAAAKHMPLYKLVEKNHPANFYVSTTIGVRDLGQEPSTLLLKDFRHCTPNNDFKQPATYPDNSKTSLNFDKIDTWLRWAKKHKVLLRSHGPISPQASKWALADDRTAEELEINMTRYMTGLSKKLNENAKIVTRMDVVNETVDNGGEWFADKPGVDAWENPWVKMGFQKIPSTFGIEGDAVPIYIVKAFQIATKHAPNVKLVYNQHTSMDPLVWEKVKQVILYLRSIGCRVDALGWQGHLGDARNEVDEAGFEYLDELIQWCHANDLEFHVTEFDYTFEAKNHPPKKKDLERQAQLYEKVLRAIIKHRHTGMVSFNCWGLVDKTDGEVSKRHKHLYDGAFNPKPSYEAIRRVLSEK